MANIFGRMFVQTSFLILMCKVWQTEHETLCISWILIEILVKQFGKNDGKKTKFIGEMNEWSLGGVRIGRIKEHGNKYNKNYISILLSEAL